MAHAADGGLVLVAVRETALKPTAEVEPPVTPGTQISNKYSVHNSRKNGHTLKTTFPSVNAFKSSGAGSYCSCNSYVASKVAVIPNTGLDSAGGFWSVEGRAHNPQSTVTAKIRSVFTAYDPTLCPILNWIPAPSFKYSAGSPDRKTEDTSRIDTISEWD